MSGRLVGGTHLKPIDIWAVGTITPPSGSGLPNQSLVLYKPAGGAWQLQHVTAEPLPPKMNVIMRRRSDPPGRVYVGMNLRTNSVPPYVIGVCAISNDYGVTWTKRFLTDPSGKFITGAPTFTSYGFILNEDAPFVFVGFYLVRWNGSAMVEIASGGYPTGLDRFSDIIGPLAVEADQSPTEAAVLKIILNTSATGPKVYRSDDGGLSWVFESQPLEIHSTSVTNGSGGVAVSADMKRFVFSSAHVTSGAFINDFWVSDDSVTWTHKDVGPGGNSLANSGPASRSKNKMFVGGAAGFANGPTYRSADGGDSWTSDARYFTRCRHLGNALYGIQGNAIFSSKNFGGTWETDTLPDLSGVGGTVAFSDING